MKSISKLLIILNILIWFNFPAYSNNCTGNFINPLTDICWDCLFPLSIGATEISANGSRKDTKDNPTSPICACGVPIPRIGIAVGFWEPSYITDVTREAFCFVNMGGLSLDAGVDIGRDYSHNRTYRGAASWHVHWYNYPLLALLNLFTDFSCLNFSGFKLAYLSELDPLWQDDELSLLLNPEVILFANPIAQAACAADCAAATIGLPLDSLFWCAGCQGGVYPMNGHIQQQVGAIQSSLLATERMAYKLHRQGLLLGTTGQEAMCSPYIMPIMRKSQYRSEIINPVAANGTFACNPLGRTSTLYEAYKQIPIKGENFGWLIWRKRNCCVL